MLIKLNVLALTSSEATNQELTHFLSEMEDTDAHVRPLLPGKLDARIDASTQADVVIVEAGNDNGMDLAADIETFNATLPEHVVVYVIGDVSNADLLRRLMRAGVRDMLVRPVVQQDLANALAGILSDKRARAMARGENVISVCAFMNAKGGSGATTLAVNAAAALATRYKARVALIDFDMQFGSCALMLDLAPLNNMSDALRQADRIDRVLLKTLMTRHASGVHVLASPSNPDADASIDPHIVRRIINAAASEYNIVIVDLPRVMAPWTIEAMRAATTSFLVVQNNLGTIRDARLLGDHLLRSGVDTRRIDLINNRAMSKAPSVSIDQLKETLKRKKAHRIRNDYPAAVTAADQGIPVHKADPFSNLATDIDNLVDYIWETHGHGKAQPQQHHHLDGIFKNKTGIFGKLFGKKSTGQP